MPVFFQAAADMADVPGGSFWMGIDADTIPKKYSALGPRLREMLKGETPRHRVDVKSFRMNRCEVTNRQFQDFANENAEWRPDRIDPTQHNGSYLKHWSGGRFPRDAADKPVTYVTWHAAVAYAASLGKRLPTEAEWEYAARGGLADPEYPWGDQFPTPQLANFSDSRKDGVVAVGSYEPNGYGLFDMAGNAWEYCLDEWAPSYENWNPPLKLNPDWREVKTRRVIRGGSWGGSALNLRVTYRDSHPVDGAGPHVGFRCVQAS